MESTKVAHLFIRFINTRNSDSQIRNTFVRPFVPLIVARDKARARLDLYLLWLKRIGIRIYARYLRKEDRLKSSVLQQSYLINNNHNLDNSSE